MNSKSTLIKSLCNPVESRAIMLLPFMFVSVLHWTHLLPRFCQKYFFRQNYDLNSML